MQFASYLALIENLGVLALLTGGLAAVWARLDRVPTHWGRCLAVGTAFAAAASAVVLVPVVTIHGATLDARAAPTLVAALFGGPLAAVLTAAAGAAARASVGGPLALGGVASFAIYALTGIVAAMLGRRLRWQWSPLGYGLLGAAGTVCVAPAFLVGVDWQTGWAALAAEWPALLVVNAGCAAGLGWALTQVDKRQALQRDLQRHAEEAFKLSQVASRTSNAVIITRVDGTIDWVNDGFTRITGYGFDEAAGRRPGELLQGAETDPEVVAYMRERLRRRQPFNVEVINYAKDGRRYWIEIDCQPIVEHGRVTSFIAIESDVTARKEVELNLLRAEQVGNMGHWTLWPGTGVIRWSDQTYRIFGLEVGGRIPDLDETIALYHPDDREDIRGIIQTAAERGEGFSFRKRLRLEGGVVKWVDIRAEAEPASDGSVAYFFGTVQDVTELVEATTQQQWQRDRFRAMAETIPGVTYQWVLWPDGREGFTYLSPNAEDVLGVPVQDLLDDWTRLAIQKVDRERFSASIAEALQHRSDWSFEGRWTHPVKGTQWLAVNAKFVAGPAGELIYNGIIVDVTEQRQASEALRSSEERLRILMDALPAEIDYVDAAGIVRYANLACRLSMGEQGVSEAGYHWTAQWSGAVPARSRAAMERALRGERTSYTSAWRPQNADAERVYDVTLVPEIGADGAVRGVFGIAFDVTAYKQREDELRAARDAAAAASRSKSMFLATMSHELRTPLNAINGYAEIMTEEVFGPLGSERYRGYAKDILTSGTYLQDLIEGLLDLSSFEAGSYELSLEAVDLSATANETIRLLQTKAHNRGVELELAVASDIMVQADRRALKQTLVNCLDNAVKFTPRGGRVRMRAYAADGVCHIHVEDTGEGIPEDKLAFVTQPFYRVQAGSNGFTATSSGAGIGLAVVARYVESMAGTLRVDSTVGQGTTVNIDLPCAAAATSRTAVA